jgi:hypothetical protein
VTVQAAFLASGISGKPHCWQAALLIALVVCVMQMLGTWHKKPEKAHFIAVIAPDLRRSLTQ